MGLIALPVRGDLVHEVMVFLVADVEVAVLVDAGDEFHGLGPADVVAKVAERVLDLRGVELAVLGATQRVEEVLEDAVGHGLFLATGGILLLLEVGASTTPGVPRTHARTEARHTS